MARIRTIKPSFFSSKSVSTLAPEARLLWIGLWVEADDVGNGRASAKYLAGAIFPHDERVTARRVQGWMKQFEDLRMIALYEVGGVIYYHVRNWSAHQKVHKPAPPRYPLPPAGTLFDPSPPPPGQQNSSRSHLGTDTGDKPRGDTGGYTRVPPGQEVGSGSRKETSTREVDNDRAADRSKGDLSHTPDPDGEDAPPGWEILEQHHAGKHDAKAIPDLCPACRLDEDARGVSRTGELGIGDDVRTMVESSGTKRDESGRASA